MQLLLYWRTQPSGQYTLSGLGTYGIIILYRSRRRRRRRRSFSRTK